ncbi:unnamed protein product [Blepharisma stoltei]|uniref:Uncharacterized protein n=1 Tax=Blepharisma stoltei TaxID=1481888 RepID=A0AAU9JR96_9CILI|nr:unnamed protein product [Blepharisma stoltei]
MGSCCGTFKVSSTCPQGHKDADQENIAQMRRKLWKDKAKVAPQLNIRINPLFIHRLERCQFVSQKSLPTMDGFSSSGDQSATLASPV